jgi:hypothetical protein
MIDPLKLVALDKDDIAVISTHLQDAIVKVADVHWRPAENRLVVGLNRFDWEAANGSAPHYYRRRSALRFDRVRSVKCRSVSPKEQDALLNLLAVEFEENDAPAGFITLVFSGGGALRLEVECLEVALVDLGPSWETTCCPNHSDVVVDARDEASDSPHH